MARLKARPDPERAAIKTKVADAAVALGRVV
jgi:hypothetical protein